MSTDSLAATKPLFSCPQCRTPVQTGSVTCQACGVDLALAAVLAERRVLAFIPTTSAPPETTPLPRFGEFLVSRGYITEQQLQAALTRQREAAAIGSHKTLGLVLIGLGTMTREQLELASIEQTKELQSALQESNRQLEQRVIERTQELQKALEKLAELNELKANFVASISHELRTPLVPIKGYSDMLRNGSAGELTEVQRGAVDVIARSSERLEELVNELIQFASSLTGKLVINDSLISLADLAGRMEDFFGPKAAAAGVQLRVEMPKPLPLVLADGEKIYWALFQLLDNAIKFTPEGGTVTLQAAIKEQHLRVSVRDTGLGIPRDQLGQIFQPFHQVAQSESIPVDGTGLGLALVKRIIEAHHSKVEVESEPGRGSVFFFELPLVVPR